MRMVNLQVLRPEPCQTKGPHCAGSYCQGIEAVGTNVTICTNCMLKDDSASRGAIIKYALGCPPLLKSIVQ